MVKDYEKYHGIVFTRFVHNLGEIKISSNINNDNSSYVLNDKIGLYLKLSKKRVTPWQFTFTCEHDSIINELLGGFQKGYVVLVCNNDGICCIKYTEYLQVITTIQQNQSKSISISRMKNEMYQVVGTDGILKYKLPDGYIEL